MTLNDPMTVTEESAKARLQIKTEDKGLAREEFYNFNADNEHIEIVQDVIHFSSIIKPNGE